MGEEQRQLARARRHLTELHVLLAWARGRLHVRVPPWSLRESIGFTAAAWDAGAHAAHIAARVARDYAPQAETPETEARP